MKPLDLIRNGVTAIRNLLRSTRRSGLEWVVLPITGSYPEFSLQREQFPFPFNQLPIFPAEASLADLRRAAERIGDDERVRGVLFRFDTLSARPAAIFSTRATLDLLRRKGKRLVAWLAGADTWDYYLASACDQIVLPPLGSLEVLGLRAEPFFMKDLLDRVGIEADLEACGEYKTSPDSLLRSSMTEPHRQMLDSILGSIYDEIVAAIGSGRGIEEQRVRDLIDRMPLSAQEAVDEGLADAVLYEDELAAYLKEDSAVAEAARSRWAPGRTRQRESRPSTWREASPWLRSPIEWTTRQAIGVVSLEGMIMPGRSRRLPLPVPLLAAQAGADTVIQSLRVAEEDPRLAAVILNLETPGGAAVASDLIWREVRRLRETKPVVILMGSEAASGGYYVAAAASKIVARPNTLTGSIGIWGGKIVMKGASQQLGVAYGSVQRGERAGLQSTLAPFTPEERAAVRAEMSRTYELFCRRVAEGRGLSEEQVDEVARGRVWTGVQAREIGLVDELGDFETALALAKELAGLQAGRDYTTTHVGPGRRERQPQPFAPAAPQPATGALAQVVLGGAGGLGAVAIGGLIDSLRAAQAQRVWALAPWAIRLLA
jgi:protease-4